MEREVCRFMSLWITNGELQDCFWRSAMSGGRATVAKGKGIHIRQAGDLTAVAEEGNAFCRQWYCEIKHVKHLALDSFFVKQTGPLHKFWKTAVKEAKHYKRDPMLIVRQNRWPILVITKHNHVAHWAQPVVTNGIIDVTLFNAMLRSRYLK